RRTLITASIARASSLIHPNLLTCVRMCVAPDHLPSEYALLHQNLGDALPHLPHNLRADNKFILTGWFSFPGLLQGRFCDISLNHRFAGRHWRTLQKLWVLPSGALNVPRFIGYASLPECNETSWERRHPCLLASPTRPLAEPCRQGCLRSQGIYEESFMSQ